MNKLLLLRHAKSSWSQNVADQERSLSKRGRKGARQMGQRLRDRQYNPSTLICSPALRARETAEIVGRLLDFDPEQIIWSDDLYLAGADTLIDQIQIHVASRNLMVVGHNPGLTNLVNRLASGRIDNMPTAAYALFEIGGGVFSAENSYPASIDFPANPGDPFAA
ncbi:MAG: histidine phosphatase family protein [Gammaproteobacteria bacterium]|nr:histidine phosphatase family protein [Gammaproteobacteria bacterium]